MNEQYRAQVELLLQVLPLIAKENEFALKGGTAINLFIWQMPRLSVDIDLTFLPVLPREETFNRISKAVSRLKVDIERSIAGSKVITQQVSGASAPTSFTVEVRRTQIKVEINFVLRGSVYPPVIKELCQEAQNKFNKYVEIRTLSTADLYGGKLCAALDRQHPRDLYDVMVLLENEGITDEIRKAFVVYLASHSRPMNELLAPNWKDISEVFHKEFVGMTTEPVELSSLLKARDEMLSTLRKDLTKDEKQFLISMKEGTPDWNILGIKGLENLPGLQWKLSNILKMNQDKRNMALEKLKDALST
jgi:predicted nucleotidyltransferase component of viral defense system